MGLTGQRLSEQNMGSIIQNNSITYAEDVGSSDTYAISLSTPPTSYVSGFVVTFKANTINTGVATLNVNGLGAKTIKKRFNMDLSDGDIKAGQIVTVIYDGTNFEMQADAYRTIRIGHGITWSGSATTGSVVNGFFVNLPTGQTASLAALRHNCASGTATFKITKTNTSGTTVDVTNFTSISLSSSITLTDPTDFALSDGDYLTVVFTAASTPTDIRITLFVDYTI